MAAIELTGGITASVWRVTFAIGPPLVLKYFDHPAFVAEDPDRAIHEAQILDLLRGTEIPAPAMIAVDADGAASGAPAVLMTEAPGSRTVPVPDVVAAATVLASIHSLVLDVPWTFHRYNPHGTASVPPWGTASLWEEALAAVAGPEPTEPRGFIHRDFHHHNLVWDGTVVTGVVDWLSACIGPPGIDIARFRLNTLFDGHPQVGGAFRDAYRVAAGVDAAHPYWDLVDAIDMVPAYEGEDEVAGWPGSGADRGYRSLVELFMAEAVRDLEQTDG